MLSLRRNSTAAACWRQSSTRSARLPVLARGYSVTENTDGKIIRSIADVRWGDEIVTQVGDGNVISVVQHTEGR